VLGVVKELSVPHSNQADVGLPLGLTVPVSVALFGPTLLATPVATVGADGALDVKFSVNVIAQLLIPLIGSVPRFCVLGETLTFPVGPPLM
jgi:hypothetical protein